MPYRMRPIKLGRQTLIAAFAALSVSLLHVAGGVIAAGTKLNVFAVTALTGFGVALPLLILSCSKRQNLTAVLRALGLRRLLQLCALDMGVVVFYYLALRSAPTGLAIAVQLTSPVILMVAATATGKRRLSLRGGLSFLLIAGALVLVGAGSVDHGSHPRMWIGLICALISAAAVAGYLVLARRAIAGLPSASVGGLIAGVNCAAASPGLLVGKMRATDLIIVLSVGLLLYAPAALLLWQAIKYLPPTVVGSFRLSEPFAGSLVAYVVYGSQLSLTQSVVVVLIIAGVYLDLTDPQASDKQPHLPRDAAP